jgi:hypothetical protein
MRLGWMRVCMVFSPAFLLFRTIPSTNLMNPPSLPSSHPTGQDEAGPERTPGR